ncbi:MAG: cytochrome c biogenesis CcdA family protein [Acidimicrobiales bacterium]
MFGALDVPFAYAFTLGMVATVNPCGFPMLPAYLSFFIGADDASADRLGSRVPRALVAAAAVSLGFMVVFTVLSFPLNAGVTTVYRVMPWLTIAVGVALVGLGVAMLLGYKPRLALPHLDRGGRDRRFGSMVLFGISYAVASLSCTIPLFLSVVANRPGPAASALTVVAYGLGMSAVLTGLTLALALARESMVRKVRGLLPHVQRISGALLVAVGLYLVYYWVFNLSRDPSETIGDNPFGGLESARTAVAGFLERQSSGLGIAIAVVAAVALAVAVSHRRQRGDAPVAADELVSR